MSVWWKEYSINNLINNTVNCTEETCNWDTKEWQKNRHNFWLFWPLKRASQLRGGPGLFNLWETRAEDVFLPWPTVSPTSLYTECMPKLDTIGQKFPVIYLFYMCTLSGVFGFKGRQPNHIKGLPWLHYTTEISCVPVLIDLTQIQLIISCSNQQDGQFRQNDALF